MRSSKMSVLNSKFILFSIVLYVLFQELYFIENPLQFQSYGLFSAAQNNKLQRKLNNVICSI